MRLAATGALVEPSPVFRAFRDRLASDDPTVEPRRALFEDIFNRLAAAGFARADLQLAWDYTTASIGSISGRMLAVRDDGFARLPQGGTCTRGAGVGVGAGAGAGVGAGTCACTERARVGGRSPCDVPLRGVVAVTHPRGPFEAFVCVRGVRLRSGRSFAFGAFDCASRRLRSRPLPVAWPTQARCTA